MQEDIINRVSKSPLVTIDLESLYPTEKRLPLLMDDWLEDGLVLREKSFREKAKTHHWQYYKDSFVAIVPAERAIVPGWSYMLLSTYLIPVTKKTIVGSLDLLESFIFEDLINAMDFGIYKDAPVIVKGCRRLPVPESAYIYLVEKLLPIARSISYGEACSTVALFKRNAM